MGLAAIDQLVPTQVFYLEYLLDERPANGRCYLDENTNRVSDESPSKGTLTYFSQRYGVSLSNLANWRRTAKFQSAYRAAVDAELRDPSYILDVIRNVRSIAMGTSTDLFKSDPLKAADLYARLTGYVAPEAAPQVAPASNLSTEELEKRVTLKAVK